MWIYSKQSVGIANRLLERFVVINAFLKFAEEEKKNVKTVAAQVRVEKSPIIYCNCIRLYRERQKVICAG